MLNIIIAAFVGSFFTIMTNVFDSVYFKRKWVDEFISDTFSVFSGGVSALLENAKRTPESYLENKEDDLTTIKNSCEEILLFDCSKLNGKNFFKVVYARRLIKNMLKDLSNYMNDVNLSNRQYIDELQLILNGCTEIKKDPNKLLIKYKK